MKKILISFILGGIIFGTIGVVASTTISSKNVTYQNKTVNNALDELYNETITGKELVAAAITNKGINTTSNDTYETMATNISSIDTDHTEINQKINNLESKHNSDISIITGSISSINQNLSNLNSRLNGFKFEKQIPGKGSFSIEIGVVYIGIYSHPAHSSCVGLYLIHKGYASTTDTNVISIVTSPHVVTMQVEANNELVFATDTWGGSLYIYRVM